jgi:DNA repair protein RecO (recombination protein O)
VPTRIPRVTHTEAIVLRHRRLGDADRIVTLLTPTRGKIDAVARGALRPRSKLAGHLEPLSRVDVLLAHGRSLDIITQAQMLEGYAGVRADLDRLSMALYLLEITDRLTIDRGAGDEHLDAQPLYDLLHATLIRIDRGDGLHLAARTFEIELLDIAGFRPEWRHCVACDRPVSADRANWSASAGGVVCPECMHIHPEAVALDPTVLRVLRAIQDGPYEEAARIRLSAELASGLERVMHALMRATTERGLLSAEFVSDARRAGAAPAED